VKKISLLILFIGLHGIVFAQVQKHSVKGRPSITSKKINPNANTAPKLKTNELSQTKDTLPLVKTDTINKQFKGPYGEVIYCDPSGKLYYIDKNDKHIYIDLR